MSSPAVVRRRSAFSWFLLILANVRLPYLVPGACQGGWVCCCFGPLYPAIVRHIPGDCAPARSTYAHDCFGRYTYYRQCLFDFQALIEKTYGTNNRKGNQWSSYLPAARAD